MHIALICLIGLDIALALLLAVMLILRFVRFDGEGMLRAILRGLLHPMPEFSAHRVGILFMAGAILLMNEIQPPKPDAQFISLVSLAAPYLELIAALMAFVLFAVSFATIRSNDRAEAAEIASLADLPKKARTDMAAPARERFGFDIRALAILGLFALIAYGAITFTRMDEDQRRSRDEMRVADIAGDLIQNAAYHLFTDLALKEPLKPREWKAIPNSPYRWVGTDKGDNALEAGTELSVCTEAQRQNPPDDLMGSHIEISCTPLHDDPSSATMRVSYRQAGAGKGQ